MKLTKWWLSFLLAISVLSAALPQKAAANFVSPDQTPPVSPAAGVELSENRTATSKLYSLGGNRYAIDSYVTPIHYKDAYGRWQDINTSFTEADSGNYIAKFTKLPYLVRVGNDSVRRIYPDRNDLSYWIDLGKPFPNMGTPTKNGNTWSWDFTNAALSVSMTNGSVKLNALLKNAQAPLSLTFPFAVQGITRTGGHLYHNGVEVATLVTPYAIDANGVRRDLNVTWNAGSVTITLDNTGLVYPIDIDPTIDVQVGASADDGWFRANDFNATDTYAYVGYLSGIIHSFYRFTGISGIDASTTIDVAYIQVYIQDNYNNPLTKIYADESGAAPAAPVNYTQANAANLTEAGVDWDDAGLAAGAYRTSPSIISVMDEIKPLTPTVILIYHKDDGSDSGANNAISGRTWNYAGNLNGAKLHIEYTAGGVSAPTVTSDNSSLVEETTATTSGNITNTGGANATSRGMQYDTDSGAPYSSNSTSSGNFTTGVFSENLTGLTKGELYYWRAFATNSAGTGYGSELTFLTKPDPATSFVSTDNGTTWISLSWANGTGMDFVEIRYTSGGTAPTDNISGTLGYWGNGTSANITGLSSGTQYSFRIFTHVTEGGLWKTADNNPATSDTTDVGVSAPTITLSAATTIEVTTATLNGSVTATGGQNPTVVVYWGTSDGGTTPASWSNNATPTSPGQPQGVAAFYYNASSLPAGTTIYFSASANNTAGTSWPAASLSFLTKPAAPTNVSATDGSSTANVTITWTKSTGATNYTIWRDSDNLTAVGDVATYTDTTAAAPTITAGTAVATDGTSTSLVTLSLTGTTANNGTTYAYKVQAYNATGLSANSTADNGYRGVGALTYQWQVSSADADADYSNIGGATTAPYDYNSAPAPTITPGAASASDNTSPSFVTLSVAGESTTVGAGRYFQAVLNANGATEVTSAANRGYRGVGSLTYQWQRSAADSDADYSNIVGGTTDPYNDTGGVTTPDGRYYKAVLNASGAAQQTTTADRGYEAEGEAVLYPPINFTVIDLGGVTATLSWTMVGTANTTLIRVSRTGYPDSTTAGELVYVGAATSVNITGLNLDSSEYSFSAWGSDGVSYSANYTTANIGGTLMTAIAEAISGLTVSLSADVNIFRLFPEGLFLLGLILIALWRSDKTQDFVWLYIAGIAVIVVSFHWMPSYPGLTVVMWGLATYLLVSGIITMAASFGASRGLSQFKEMYERAKRHD